MLEQMLQFGQAMRIGHGHAGGLAGGPKGGAARARNLTPERRKLIAREAAEARWSARLPELVRWLFWEHDFQTLNLAADEHLVLLKILSYGGAKERAWLRRRLGDDRIRAWIRENQGKGLTIAQMTPWVSEPTARRWQRLYHGDIWVPTRMPSTVSGTKKMCSSIQVRRTPLWSHSLA